MVSRATNGPALLRRQRSSAPLRPALPSEPVLATSASTSGIALLLPNREEPHVRPELLDLLEVARSHAATVPMSPVGLVEPCTTAAMPPTSTHSTPRRSSAAAHGTEVKRALFGHGASRESRRR